MSQVICTLSQLNGMDASQLVQVLDGIYEHSPWVIEQAATQCPFASAETLAAAMRSTMDTAGIRLQLKLMRAHPELAGKAIVRGELTVELTHERSDAGLNQCSPEEFARLQALNAQYNERFGFPFILAVCSYGRYGITSNFGERMGNNHDTELCASLEQIHHVAGFHLAGSVIAN